MSKCNEPEWDIDESAPGMVGWWSEKADRGLRLAALPIDPPPNLHQLHWFASSVLRAIAEDASEAREDNQIATRVVKVGHEVFVLPAPLRELSDTVISLLRHTSELIESNACEPDFIAGYLAGKMEAVANNHFAEMGKKLSKRGKTLGLARHKEDAAKRQSVRLELEERIATLTRSRSITRTSAISRIAKEENVSERAIRKRLEREK